MDKVKYRHKARGTEYYVLGNALLQTAKVLADMAPLVVYRAADGTLWARSQDEFYDGRFEPVAADQDTVAAVAAWLASSAAGGYGDPQWRRTCQAIATMLLNGDWQRLSNNPPPGLHTGE